ncbi:MAG: Photosystem II manganese-stabilizing polypeptide [Cyanobacteria bacterium QH_8_48_120]|jgi:photosystem II oxygen-evolving enhancer protein 1|nr:MAG: Photosystem II manganese-stabilizing polypeptide [Cyanobacteria bacterium QH_1_48_107]PSO56387.1 MAG: Photosystem II manganese-stabilizing polypeptide [Cyanobacteria bacterium QH_7_48_89]PSO60441.1 MAG: Photosystem II manganese-stabilizing polypeptide [Cyanobacteria bacterium QH_10_48_56]PSO60918.1 MAG: Photosystem II manganese-stabilizing polypeptide [Cyanobacteria bacterium QH_2_48_84]PSO62297.1 MAG: Photosystem II manganese-stabilizing polypeptide [Cyanobacteria bacterium QH_6_48_35]
MKYRAFIAAFLALCLGALTACSQGPATAANKKQLTYDQVLGTGLANKCPRLEETSRGSVAISPDKSYAVRDMCIQPTDYFVKEEPLNKRREAEFIRGKLLTRNTSSLDQIRGKLLLDQEGKLTLIEEGGIDFQPITVKLPGGEEVPFNFTVKGLVAQAQAGTDKINTTTDFEGGFRVPSYRGGGFLDTRGRGAAAGYDSAVGVYAGAYSEEYAKENVKRIESSEGEISFLVAKVNSDTGEIAGTFESNQPSHTDMGAVEPEEVKVRGIFYAVIEPEA